MILALALISIGLVFAEQHEAEIDYESCKSGFWMDYASFQGRRGLNSS
jgi:hypothetical protein